MQFDILPISGTIELTVVENKSTQQVQFTMRDEGMGISPNDQLRVFERFLEQIVEVHNLEVPDLD